MKKKKLIAAIYMEEKGSLGVRIRKKNTGKLPDALASLLTAFIHLSKESDMKDYEINDVLKAVIATAWNINGGCKDIVEEIE